MKKIKIVYIITGLGNGGAEMMLFKLIEGLNKVKYEIEVISLLDKGIMGEKLEKLGIKVYELKINKFLFFLLSLKKGIKICKNKDIIQSWMYHADLYALIISFFTHPKKLIWGIRRSDIEISKIKVKTFIIMKINSYFSKYVNIIISCSVRAKETHIKYGYKKDKIKIIPNGFPIDKYYFIKSAREKIEKELKIDSSKKIVSLVGRWNILKDYKNCLKAIKNVEKEIEDIVLILCGTGINYKNKELVNLIEEINLGGKVFLLDRREDIPEIMSATDVYISSSKGEGFPNVIGEAMACESICVVTDVGDSAYIVGEAGIVVRKENSDELGEAIKKVLNFSKAKKEYMKKSSRERIINNFEISKIINEYEKNYIIKRY